MKPPRGGRANRFAHVERERGQVTVLALTVILCTITCAGAAGLVAVAAVARHQAAGAADLGALAGAADLAVGLPQDVACATAARFVVANSAVMIGCDVSGPDLVVRAAVNPGLGLPNVSAAARAGPRADELAPSGRGG